MTTSFESVLMWAHYADSHRGLCAEFEMDPVCFSKAEVVAHSAERPEVRIDAAHGDEASKERFFETGMHTKAQDWAYEDEWRLCLEGRVGVRRLRTSAPHRCGSGRSNGSRGSGGASEAGEARGWGEVTMSEAAEGAAAIVMEGRLADRHAPSYRLAPSARRRRRRCVRMVLAGKVPAFALGPAADASARSFSRQALCVGSLKYSRTDAGASSK